MYDGGGSGSSGVTLPAVQFTYGNSDFSSAGTPWPAEAAASVPFQPGVGAELALKNSQYNLGWGYRFPGTGQWPSVEAMLVDIDGDGLLDRVVNAEDGNTPTTCGAWWEKNLGNFTFGSAQPISLPTLQWATQGDSCTGSTTVFKGGENANSSPDSSSWGGYVEGCHLNYQLTMYSNNMYPRACPDGDDCPSSETCSGNLRYCGQGALTAPGPTYFAYRWMDIDGDGLVDLIASPSGSNYDVIQGDGLNPQGPICYEAANGQPYGEPLLFGTSGPNGNGFPACPGTPYGAGPSLGSYEMCGGMFPWMIYLNHGGGRFGSGFNQNNTPIPDSIVYQPIPLESQSADASATANPIDAAQAVVDIDGDGLPDGVVPQEPSPGSNAWSVYLNSYVNHFYTTGPGQFQAVNSYLGMTPFPFQVWPGDSATTDVPSGSTANFTNNSYPQVGATQGLADFNGDGLPDRWFGSAGTPSAVVQLNNGTGFQGSSQNTSRPGDDGQGVDESSFGPASSIVVGCRAEALRTIDLDADGRFDIINTGSLDSSGGPITPNPIPSFNEGAQFGGPSSSMFDPSIGGVFRWITVSTPVEYGNTFVWELRSDMLDLDGDGIPESLDFTNAATSDNPGQFSMSKIATPTQPPRLLATINNGRGASTTVSYATMTNSNVVSMGGGSYMPHSQWVVQSVTTTDSIASTTTTTSYNYFDPVYGPDDRGKYAFRGFEVVNTNLPSGAMRQDQYGYLPDWSGRLDASITYPAASDPNTNSGDIRSIDETTYSTFTLFDGAITTFHPTLQQHYTCQNSQQGSACISSPAGYTQTTTTMSACAPGSECTNTTNAGSAALLWEATETLLQAGSAAANGDRETLSTFTVDTTSDGTAPTVYRVRPTQVTKQSQVNGAYVEYAETQYGWDTATFRFLDFETVFTDSTHVATTERGYDTNTGNVVQRWKPNQLPGGGGDGQSTTYSYDSRLLYVATETSEAGGYYDEPQVRTYNYEYGTGTKLETQGPNSASCYRQDPPDCPSGTPTLEDHRIQVDALGRTLFRYETYAGDGSTSYLDVQIGSNVYVDAYVGGTPPSVTHYVAIDGALDYAGEPVRYGEDMTTLDGHGRPTQKTVYSNGAAPANAVTGYVYRNDGTLASVSVPDPSQNSSATVTFNYTFDSLGRPLTITRPDSATSPSGVSISYNGLQATSLENLGAGSGTPAASTTTIKDSFGRLIEVDELNGSNGPEKTTYQYDPADNVNQVQDPEGNITTLTHDFASRRTAITRGTRTWSYTYDGNGNLTSESFPTPNGQPNANYTNTMTYDDLDELTTKLIGPRAMSSADVKHFGAYETTYDWGLGNNGISRLAQANFYGASGTRTGYITYGYNAQGQLQATKHEPASLANYPSTLTRSFNVDYSLNGALATVYYYEAMGSGSGAEATISQIALDARGQPRSVEIAPYYPSDTSYNYVVNTRNVAGLVTSQAPTIPSGQTWPSVQSSWTYDTLGRVTNQTVQVAGATAAEQALAYFGNDDPSTLDQYLGSEHRQFSYQYDQRHQLISAVENTTQGYFTSAYSYGSAGRFATADETTETNGSGSDSLTGATVVPRNVSYQYGGDDPEEVTALLQGSGTLAAYQYDEAGNETLRCNGAIGSNGTCSASGSASGDYYVFTYDGEDQMRRAEHYSVSGSVLGSEEYWYDDNGKRTQTITFDENDNQTAMIWWIGDTEAHYDSSGNVLHVYSYISLGGPPVARVDRTANTTLEVEYEYHGLGNSTLATVDQTTGTINSSFSYAPFGEVIQATDSSGGEGLAAHPRKFNDKYQDAISGLAYHGARYYDELSLTWTQGDPLYRFAPDSAWTQPRRANLYSNDLNNPLRYLDPDGRSPAAAAAAAPVLIEAGPPGWVVLGVIGTVAAAPAIPKLLEPVDWFPVAPPPSAPPPTGGDIPATPEQAGPHGTESQEPTPVAPPVDPLPGAPGHDQDAAPGDGSGSSGTGNVPVTPLPPLPGMPGYKKTPGRGGTITIVPGSDPIPPATAIPDSEKKKRPRYDRNGDRIRPTKKDPKQIKSIAPADSNGDGVVTPEEEEAWSQRENGQQAQ